MAQANGKCNEFIEDGGLKLQAEEIDIVRKQCGIKIPLDRCQIKRVILKARMIAQQHYGPHGECCQQRQSRS